MIGIDFGTTNSAIAHVIAGQKPVPIADQETNQLILPSFVYYMTPEQVIVGENAKSQYYELSARDGGRIFKSIKRKLKQKLTYNIFGQSVRDFEVAACIFKELKLRAETLRGEKVDEAVVTIPVYFDADQRRSVRKAAEIAGINVKCFLHEPIAVAFQEFQKAKATQHVMVFDWGGGTLDISVLRVDSGMIHELEIGGDEALGGDDLDRCLATNTLEWFLKTNSVEPFDIEDNPSCLQRLLSRSETAKIQLSDTLISDTSIDIVSFYLDKDISRLLDRPEFENITKGIYNLAINKLTETLEKIKLKPSDIDIVILAGGSSRIPLVIRSVEKIFGQAKINTLMNTDTCVAEGAALVSFLDIEPVLSVPIGIEFEDGFIYKFLERGTSLKKSQSDSIQLFVPDPRSGKANIKIYESESGKVDAPDSRIKKILSVPVNPDCAEYINVKFDLDENQCLKIEATGMNTGIPRSCQIKDIKIGFKLN